MPSLSGDGNKYQRLLLLYFDFSFWALLWKCFDWWAEASCFPCGWESRRGGFNLAIISLSCWVLKFSLTWGGLVTALTQLPVHKPKARAINKENELFQLESCHFSLSSHAVGSCSIWFWLKCSLRFDVCVEPHSVSGTLFNLLSTQTGMFRLSNQFFFFF